MPDIWGKLSQIAPIFQISDPDAMGSYLGIFEKFKYLEKLMTNKKISFHSFKLTVIAQISENMPKKSIVACNRLTLF